MKTSVQSSIRLDCGEEGSKGTKVIEARCSVCDETLFIQGDSIGRLRSALTLFKVAHTVCPLVEEFEGLTLPNKKEAMKRFRKILKEDNKKVNN